MGTFCKKVVLQASAAQIPDMAESIKQDFAADGYEVSIENLMSGGCDVSISKGGVFRTVVGMKTALKVTLTPQTNGVLFDAHVGIFGQQVVPALVVYFVFWPIIITQIVGLIQQSKMDDRALEAAQRAIANSANNIYTANIGKFCSNCGASVSNASKFCPECGARLN